MKLRIAMMMAVASISTAGGLTFRHTTPAFTARGAFMALIVTELDSSVRWYESNLGLHVVKQGKSPRVAAETVVLSGNGMIVELIHFTDRRLPKRIVSDFAPVAGPVKAGAILSAVDFDALRTHLTSRGIDAGAFDDKEMGYRSSIVRDNDGNIIQFFAPM